VQRRHFLGSSIALGAATLAPGCRFTDQSDKRKVLEVAIFEGGFGLDWHKEMARRYEALHPDIRVDLWGDPRVDEKIKPRILRRNPPDLASCNLPVWKLIVAGKLHPLDNALASPAYDQPDATWRETLVSGVLSDFVYENKTWALPSNLGTWVCWYDKRQFRENGWTVPATWSEFAALCEKIKASGTAPLAFQGKYPTYAWSTILSLFQRQVSFEKWYAVQDLEPGAFLDPGFVNAAKLMQQMAQQWFQPGALAMTHTESQLEWVNGRAAMVFCGLWLKNEMKAALPEGFEMSCFPVPMVDDAAGDPKAVYGGGGENFVVFKDAKEPELAADFLKFLLSMGSAKQYVGKLDTLSPVKECFRGVPISSALQGAVDIVSTSTRLYSDRLGQLYLEFSRTILQQGQADLLSGKITPEQFAQRLEDGADAVRRNPEIYKPPRRGVPPA
jgi:N-acetylglucosamine transport system substrate-binding protein